MININDLNINNYYKVKYQNRIYIGLCTTVFVNQFNKKDYYCTFMVFCCEPDRFPSDFTEIIVGLAFREIILNFNKIQELTFIADANKDDDDAFNKAKALFYQIRLEGKENLIY